MIITDLFCTPEQGQRLVELVPKLESAFVWVTYNGRDHFISDKRTCNTYIEYGATFSPALTLQELRDVAKDHVPASDLITKFQAYLYNMTAPKLADWIIERLEAKP